MVVEFEFYWMNFQAVVIVTSPAVPPRMTGHPDTWSEGEPGEIEIASLRVCASDAAFLLDSDFADQIEMAALDAAEKYASEFENDCRFAAIDDYTGD